MAGRRRRQRACTEGQSSPSSWRTRPTARLSGPRHGRQGCWRSLPPGALRGPRLLGGLASPALLDEDQDEHRRDCRHSVGLLLGARRKGLVKDAP